jgi:hypothetical protein
VTSFARCAGSQIAASTILLALARFTSLNLWLTISGQHQTSPSGHASRAGTVTAFVSGSSLIYPRGGASDMSVDNVRPEANLLSAFTLTIAGAFVAGLPMALAIIWVCS